MIPDPPDYKKCVAGLKKQLSAQKGAPKQSDAALKKQCKTQYDQLKGEVMQFLIQAQWVQQEAEDRDVEVSDAEVKKSFNQQKKQAFPKEADYKKFLKDSGMNEEDILYRVKLDQLQTKLTQKVSKDKVKITNADIEAYYEKNKKRFAQPQRRDLNVVLTKTKAKADQAKAELESGKSFKVVSKKYSIDQASKAQGGKLPDLAKGKQDPALDKAAFTAKKGKVEGPVKTQFGYYVFQVTTIKAASQQSLAQAQRHHPQPAAQPARAEGAGLVRQGLPQEVQGEDELRRGLPRGRVQERPKSSTETAAGRRGAAGRRPDPAGRGRSAGRRSPGRARRIRPRVALPHRSRRPRHRRPRRAAGPRRRRPAAQRLPSPSHNRSRGSARPPGRHHPAPAGRVPVGPRAGRALDRARTPSRRPTSWPTPPTAATTPSWWTSWATCCSRCTSWRCCSRSARRAAWSRGRAADREADPPPPARVR